MFFDAHLRARGLSAHDLADLRYFGIVGALAPADDTGAPRGAEAIQRGWEELAGRTIARLRSAGLAGYAALGLHPRHIPWRGVEALLAELPELLGRPEVVAIGSVGLDKGGPREEELFARQLALAKDLRLAALVCTPFTDKVRLTRRTLAVLREAELPPERVIVDQANGQTVRMILACGFRAGLSLSRSRGVEEAVRLVRGLGPGGLVLESDAGEGGGDLLGLARAADRMAKAGLSEAVIRRVCGGNALAVLGIDPRILRGPAGATMRR